MFSRRFFVITFFICYLIFLTASLPLNIVWGWVAPYVQTQQVQVDRLSGLIWQGSARLTYNRIPINLSWKFQPVQLIQGKFAIALQATQDQFNLEGQLWISMSRKLGIENLQGYVDDQFANNYLLPDKTLLAGRLWLDELSLFGDLTPAVTQASGEARWTGGMMQLPVGRDLLKTDIPPLSLSLSNEPGQILLTVKDNEQLQWVSGYLNKDGWLEIQVMQTAADKLNLPIQGSSRDVLFEMKQKLL